MQAASSLILAIAKYESVWAGRFKKVLTKMRYGSHTVVLYVREDACHSKVREINDLQECEHIYLKHLNNEHVYLPKYPINEFK